MTETFIPNAKPQIVDDAIQRSVFTPTAHYVHPVDPSKRTAMCGAPIVGIPAFEPYVLCATCAHLLAAVDWSLLPEAWGRPPGDDPQPSL